MTKMEMGIITQLQYPHTMYAIELLHKEKQAGDRIQHPMKISTPPPDGCWQSLSLIGGGGESEG